MSKQTEHGARYGLTGNALKDTIMNDNKHDDGGPAFPTTGLTLEAYHSGIAGPGMSLRDYFAGQAILLAGAMAMEMVSNNEQLGKDTVELTAWQAFVIANAMLKAREL